MIKKCITLLLTLLLILNITVVSAAEADPKDSAFESNIGNWTFAGDGGFGEKANYYGKNGKFMSDQTVQYAYAISEMEVNYEKSFTFDVEFDVPNYDSGGADKGWCWQTILFGVQDETDPGADSRIAVTFQHFPEGQEAISFNSSYSGYSENTPMPKEKLNDMSHKVLIYYSIIDESVTVTVDGEEMFKMPKAKDEMQGKLGFGATWSCMRILKAVYTELDETPAPATATPEKTPSPEKTEEQKTTKAPTDDTTKDRDPKMVIMIVLAVLVVIAVIAVILVAIKRKK